MKILAVVTLVSPLGEYGGPLRVAVNQAKALIARGHAVTIAGAFAGYEHAPLDIDGVPARLFRAWNVVPGGGHAGLASPGLWSWVARRASHFDMAHIHLARDLVTLPTARVAKARGLRYVVQTHGMIDESDRLLAKPLDMAMTRTVLCCAQRVLYLTEREHDDLAAVAGRRSLALAELPNGVPNSQSTASDTSVGTEVLFLGRLAPRKRPLVFVAMANSLRAEFPNVRFALVGPDDGEGIAVRDAVDDATARGVSITLEGAIPPNECARRMQQAAVYVLPAIDEPYPMTVLEAMSVGLPVVVTDSCGLASFVETARAGLVVGQDQASLVNAVRQLLADTEFARACGDRGRTAVREHRSMSSIAAKLEIVYTE